MRSSAGLYKAGLWQLMRRSPAGDRQLSCSVRMRREGSLRISPSCRSWCGSISRLRCAIRPPRRLRAVSCKLRASAPFGDQTRPTPRPARGYSRPSVQQVLASSARDGRVAMIIGLPAAPAAPPPWSVDNSSGTSHRCGALVGDRCPYVTVAIFIVLPSQ